MPKRTAKPAIKIERDLAIDLLHYYKTEIKRFNESIERINSNSSIFENQPERKEELLVFWQEHIIEAEAKYARVDALYKAVDWFNVSSS